MSNHFEVIVAGLGANGSAAIYQLAKAGKKVLGIDKFKPPHTNGIFAWGNAGDKRSLL